MNKLIFISLACALTCIQVFGCWTELHRAVLENEIPKAKAIITNPELTDAERDALINQQDNLGQTPLHLAAMMTYEEITKFLLRFHPKVNIHDNHGFMPIHWTACKGNAACAALLLEHGATPNDLTLENETPLLVATYNRHFDIANLFLESGSDPNIQGMIGMTALHWSINYECSPDLIGLEYDRNRQLLINLFKHGASRTTKNQDDMTPEGLANESFLTCMKMTDQKLMQARNSIFALACCSHARLGSKSPFRELSLDMIRYIYWLLKEAAYEPIKFRPRVTRFESCNSFRFIAVC